LPPAWLATIRFKHMQFQKLFFFNCNGFVQRVAKKQLRKHGLTRNNR
jgi:hypothetical protein